MVLTELHVSGEGATALQNSLQRLSGYKAVVYPRADLDVAAGMALLFDPAVISVESHKSIPMPGRLAFVRCRMKGAEAAFTLGMIYHFSSQNSRQTLCRILNSKAWAELDTDFLWMGDFNGAPTGEYYLSGIWRGDLKDKLCRDLSQLENVCFLDTADPEAPTGSTHIAPSLNRPAREKRDVPGSWIAGSANRIDHAVAGGFLCELFSGEHPQPTNIPKATHWAVSVLGTIPSIPWARIPRYSFKPTMGEHILYNRTLHMNLSGLKPIRDQLSPASQVGQIQMIMLLAMAQTQHHTGPKVREPKAWWRNAQRKAALVTARAHKLLASDLHQFTAKQWRALGHHTH